MSKKKYSNKAKNRKSQKKSSLKPVLSTIIVCILMGVAFYIGTRFDSIQSNLIKKPDNTQNAPITKAPDSTQNTQVTEQPTVTTAPEQKRTVSLTLYFPNSNVDGVVPIQRQVEIDKMRSLKR